MTTPPAPEPAIPATARSTKTVSTTNGPVTISVPRDRNGEFEPQIVPKRARRVGQIDELVLSCYARGMSTRDIEAHLLEVYGVTASRELVSNITDVVTDEIEIWRNRPVDEVYPIVYIDGIRIKVRDKGAVTIKSAHLVIGVDVDGRKHALGCWIAETEGAKFWHSVLTQLRNRGLRDILIACCDGLTGLPDAITSVFPDTVVQTCVVHVIRNAMRFVSYQDRKKIADVDADDLHRAHRRGRRDRADGLRRSALGTAVPGGGRDVWRRAGSGSSRSWTTRPNSGGSSTPRMKSSTPSLVAGLWCGCHFSARPPRQPEVAGPQPGSRWSARSAARTYDLDRGEDRRSVRRRWAWSDPVAKSRVWGCQPCRAALPREGLESRAPVVAATSTPDLPRPSCAPSVRAAGRVGCQAATMVR